MSLPSQIYQDLKDLLPPLTEAIKQGVEYSGDLFMRFIAYDIATSAAVILAVLLILWFLNRQRNKFIAGYGDNQKTEREFGRMVSGIMLLIATFLGAAPVAENVNIILKDAFVPELRVAELVKNYLDEQAPESTVTTPQQ